ncbi:hypothetical protein F4779DRAFT_370356 [Xylariaceae sp. FL0662B]|nr:hypothetical protein F4779DRAFT_370356 [Xylariaceae sp. FL0662B]
MAIHRAGLTFSFFLSWLLLLLGTRRRIEYLKPPTAPVNYQSYIDIDIYDILRRWLPRFLREAIHITEETEEFKIPRNKVWDSQDLLFTSTLILGDQTNQQATKSLTLPNLHPKEIYTPVSHQDV